MPMVFVLMLIVMIVLMMVLIVAVMTVILMVPELTLLVLIPMLLPPAVPPGPLRLIPVPHELPPHTPDVACPHAVTARTRLKATNKLALAPSQKPTLGLAARLVMSITESLHLSKAENLVNIKLQTQTSVHIYMAH